MIFLVREQGEPSYADHGRCRIGATGHIGGAVLDELIRSRPGISITAVVRKHEDRATLEARYPGVEVVVGSLEETELLRELASEAAVIISRWLSPS